MKKIGLIIIVLFLVQSCLGKKDSPPPPPAASSNTPFYFLKIDDGILGSTISSPLTQWNEIPNVDHYEVSIGTQKNRTDVKDWVDVGLLTKTNLNIPSNLSNNTILYTNIRAFDKNKNIIANSSGDGWTVANSLTLLTDPVSFNAEVNAIEIDNEGNKYIAGYFNAVNGQAANGILPLTSTGNRNNNYNFAAASGGYIAKLNSGKFIYWGHSGSYNGTNAKNIIRLNTDGSLDSSFNLDSTLANTYIYAVSIFSNDELLIKYYINGTGYVFKKISTTGLIDTSFSTNFTNVYANSPTESVIGSKFYISFNNSTIRYDSNGTVDNTFTPISPTGKFKLMQDGNTLLINSYLLRLYDSNMVEDSSFFTNASNAKICSPNFALPTTLTGKYIISYIDCRTNIPKIGKLNRDGTLDSTFVNNFGSGFSPQFSIFDMAIDNSNRIYIASTSSYYNNASVPLNLFRINHDGTLDNTFISNNAGLNYYVNSLLVDGSNVIATGYFTSFGGSYTGSLIKLNKNDSLVNFTNIVRVNGTIHDLKVKNNYLYIVGEFTRVNGSVRNKIAKLKLDGTLTEDFNFSGFNSDAIVRKLNFFKDGKIAVIGSFKSYNQYTVNNLVKLLPDGSRDSSFTTSFQPSTYFTDFGIQSDDKIILSFNGTITYRGSSLNYIFRLNPNGTLDSEYNTKLGTNFDNPPNSILTLQDDSSFFCGSQSTFDGIPSVAVTKLKKDGSLDFDFKFPNEIVDSSYCQKISLTLNNQILLGGYFSSSYLNENIYIMTLLPDGSIDKNYDAGISGYGTNFFSLKQSSDGKIYTGGSFDLNNIISYLKIIGW